MLARALAFFGAYLGRLRFPRLALLTLAFFLGDLVVPDFIPFADEIGLGLLTALLGSWRKRRAEKEEQPS